MTTMMMMMPSISYLKQLTLLSLFSLVSSGPLRSRESNGLATTPQMGWDTYNHYSCDPTQAIVHSNAQAMVDFGLADVGYYYVITDCGWSLPDRTAEGTLTWNPAIFPAGYPALGDFIHGLGLGFGVYADGGILMCMTGSPEQAGSLGYEKVDAATFAEWGADLLKYDNCYSDAAAGYPDVNYAPTVSPSGRYLNMSNALLESGRDILFAVCDWGVDFPSAWAPALGNSWRIANDIIPEFATVARILNQAVPQTNFAGPGNWLDLDMLEVGNNVFTTDEEQTHFTMWAIVKSPLIMGCALNDTETTISAASLAVLKNTDVISYNQDSLGVAASFRRRWTAQGYEVWAGPLSDNRYVAALINNDDVATELTLDLPVLGLQKAGTLKDVWNDLSFTDVLTSYTASVGAHGTILVELGDTTPAGNYSAADATSSDDGLEIAFTKVYAITSSASFTGLLEFSGALEDSEVITVDGVEYTAAAKATSLSFPLSLDAGDDLTVTVTSKTAIDYSYLNITEPAETFYPSTSFSTTGNASVIECYTDLCTPVGYKATWIGGPESNVASISVTAPEGSITGSKYIIIYFCNNDIAFDTSFTTGTNTRNMTISVNGEVTRIEAPLSGRTSELFSPADGWEDTGLFGVLVDGWETGTNVLEFGNAGGADDLVNWAPDFVGVGVLW